METIALADDSGNAAIIAPELGGWLLRYERQTAAHGPVDVLHYDLARLNAYPELGFGSPLMFPIAGYSTSERGRDRYRWQEVEREMPPHGFARRLPWKVREVSNDAVTLVLDANQLTRECYPFEFRLTLCYELRDGALASRLVVENLGDRPMPFSTGFHPYIRTPLTTGHREQCLVRIPAARELRIEAGHIIAEADLLPRCFPGPEIGAPARHFGDLEKLRAEVVDTFADLRVIVEAVFTSPFQCLTTWAPVGDVPFCCVEPRTSLPDPFSYAQDDQLTVLPPGAAFSGSMRLDLIVSRQA